MRNTFVDAIIAQFSMRDDLFILSGDAGLGVFDRFREEHPGRFLNLGVAEQNAASLAAGMAMAGWKVVLYNIIPFVLYRCYEQVRNDICYQRLPVVLAGIGSGVSYAPAGMTHYSVEDLALARSLPNLEVLSPCDPVEAKLAALHALEAPGPVYVRLAKRGEPRLHVEESFDLAAPRLMTPGDSPVALLFHGPIGEEVLGAARLLAGSGLAPRVISVPRVQPLPTSGLPPLLEGIRHVVVVEEHYSDSGLGSGLAAQAALEGWPWRIHILGIPPHFLHEIRTTRGMREVFGLDASGIARRVREAAGGNGR